MNNVIFIIPEEEQPRFLEISKNTTLGVTCKINRIMEGYQITVSALGGRENDIDEFIALLRSSGFSI